MAITGNTSDSGTEQKPSNQATSSTAAPSFSQFNIRDLATRAILPSGLSADGKKYSDYLIKTLNEFISSDPSLRDKIYIGNTNVPPDSIVVDINGKILFILFQETISVARRSIPPTTCISEAFTDYMKRRRPVGNNKNPRPLSSIIVSPVDYIKAETMFFHIKNLILNLTSDIEISANVLKGEPLLIDTNMTKTLQFINQVSPHTVMPRADFGFKLSVQPKKSGYNRNNKNFYSSYTAEVQDIAAVTGYVELLFIPYNPMNPNSTSFVPLIHISEIVSLIPDIRIGIMLISLAAEVFIRNKIWKTQFYNFSKDQPNIGNLIYNGKDPYFAENADQVNAFIQKNVTNAEILVMDVVNGRSIIPGMELFALTSPKAISDLRNIFASVMTDRNISASSLPAVCASPKYYEFIGNATLNGTPADTRWIDYLYLMVHHRQDQKVFASFLNRYSNVDPSKRFETIGQFFPDATSLYDSTVVEIDPTAIIAIQREIFQYAQIIDGIGGVNSPIDFSNSIQNFAMFKANSPGFGIAADVDCYTSFQRNYFG